MTKLGSGSRSPRSLRTFTPLPFLIWGRVGGGCAGFFTAEQKAYSVILRVPRGESRSSSSMEGCVNRVDEPAVAVFERRAKQGRKSAGILREARVEFVIFLISGIAKGLWN